MFFQDPVGVAMVLMVVVAPLLGCLVLLGAGWWLVRRARPLWRFTGTAVLALCGVAAAHQAAVLQQERGRVEQAWAMVEAMGIHPPKGIDAAQGVIVVTTGDPTPWREALDKARAEGLPIGGVTSVLPPAQPDGTLPTRFTRDADDRPFPPGQLAIVEMAWWQDPFEPAVHTTTPTPDSEALAAGQITRAVAVRVDAAGAVDLAPAHRLWQDHTFFAQTPAWPMPWWTKRTFEPSDGFDVIGRFTDTLSGGAPTSARSNPPVPPPTAEAPSP